MDCFYIVYLYSYDVTTHIRAIEGKIVEARKKSTTLFVNQYRLKI